MQYVFNPNNNQINPVTESTFVDPTLRDKVVSSKLYSLVCKGKVPVSDIAAMFAVGKSPEILVKNHTAVKASPQVSAPVNETVLPDSKLKPDDAGTAGADDTVSVGGAFDGRDLVSKTQSELMIIATQAGIDVNAEGFAPTRQNLMKAIKAKAMAAEAAASAPAPAEPVSAEPPVATE